MPDINILSPHLADLIAAGEVVERPASVIKELVENSFDADAKNITIELRGGGMTFIRVTDDGGGMLPEDAGICFMRHATSKLSDARGLEAIGTMGFRGEALAAISAVSRIELITRRRGENEGTRVILEAGDILEMTPYGCPEGTSIIIRDLFYNTPARLKFMKSDKSEGGACLTMALRCALGRPECSVRLIKDGKEEFFSPGDGKKSSCIYSLLGRETALELMECFSEDESFSVSGFTGSPRTGHGNRAKQYFFCNGRAIKSQLLQSALEQAYKNTLLTGRYPACVLYLTVSPAAVDVNVHPAKTEVKFRDERKAFDSIYYAVISALKAESGTAEITLSPSTKAAASPKKDFFQSMSATEFREKQFERRKSEGYVSKPTFNQNVRDVKPIPCEKKIEEKRGEPTVFTLLGEQPSETSGHILSQLADDGKQAPPDLGTIVIGGASKENVTGARVCDSGISYKTNSEAQSVLTEAETILPKAENDFRLIGEAMNTYILVERDNALLLIDKHAAHERMIFDRIKAQGREIMSQALLLPVTLKLTAGEIELLEQNSESLIRLGFEIDLFGEDSVILRGVPADTDAAEAPAMVEEICEKLKKGVSLSEDGAADEILHTVACKAAIKAGRRSNEAELSELVRAVVSGEVKYCPHGRPVSVTLTKKQLDKEFSRIV
ncbi:MAG: DNA mismatch repair endonuclease MutL [Oscillospiraceae bacterium]